MAWQRGTVRIKYPASPGRGQNEDAYEEFPGYVNADHGLTVRKVWGGWQVDSPEGHQIFQSIRTMHKAKEVADAVAPLAPYGWTAEGTRRAASEDPEWGRKVEATAVKLTGYRVR